MGPRVKGGICPPAGLEGGYRQCFRRLEPNLTLFRRLCQTYEILCVDVVGGRSVHEIDDDLKAGHFHPGFVRLGSWRRFSRSLHSSVSC